MRVELEVHTGVRYDEVAVSFEQWRVFATGGDGNRVLVGYLSFDPKMPLMLICNQPMNLVAELVRKCSAITGREVLPPYEIVMPPEIDNEAGEDNDEGEDDDDQEAN